MGEVKVIELDAIIKELAEKERQAEEIKAELKKKNIEIQALEGVIRGHLAEANRSEYDSPFGKVSMREELQVRMPQGEEEKNALWAWMRERGIFDRYATVQANSLKALFLSERDIAVNRDGVDPLTFALPGMEPATVFEVVKFRPKK